MPACRTLLSRNNTVEGVRVEQEEMKVEAVEPRVLGKVKKRSEVYMSLWREYWTVWWVHIKISNGAFGKWWNLVIEDHLKVHLRDNENWNTGGKGTKFINEV